MYFVHPQIKFNISNLKHLFFCLFGSPNEKILERLEAMFPQKRIIFTDMGRSAFKLIVEELGLQNSQMLVPAYICDVFFPVFKKYNIQPIFLDANPQTFNIELDTIPGLSPKSILVCHTYGLSANLDQILALAKKYNLKIIEDSAHSFGAKYNGIYTGNFGDAAFFSLYKSFPTLRGGMAILPLQCNGKCSRYIDKTDFGFRDFISLLNCFSLFAFLFKKFGGQIAPKIQRKEKTAEPSQINKVSLNLFGWSMRNLEENLKRRIELALFFKKKLEELGFEMQKPQNNIFTYLSGLVPKNLKSKRDQLVKNLRKKHIFCTRIWKDPIILNPEVQKEYGINLDQFPNTLDAAQRIVNFPLQNHYTKKDIQKIIKALKKILAKNPLDSKNL